MNIRIIGAILIIAGCGSLGIMIAASYARQERCLRQFMECLQFMLADLPYRMTPLPELCRCTANQSSGVIRQFFINLTTELEDQISPDVNCCVKAALSRAGDIPEAVKDSILELGNTLGRFDIDGQVQALNHIWGSCDIKLKMLDDRKDMKLRNFKTLGLCAGAAIAILFV